MPFSQDLTNIANKFHSVDPATNSIDENCDPIAQRTWWQTFLGYVINIITFGLIAKNPELDRATNKVITAVNGFFTSQSLSLSQAELQELRQIVTKLKTIITDNSGSNSSQVDALAERINQLVPSEKNRDEKDKNTPVPGDRRQRLLSKLRNNQPFDADDIEIPDDASLRDILQSIPTSGRELTDEASDKINQRLKQKFTSILDSGDLSEILDAFEFYKFSSEIFILIVDNFVQYNKNPKIDTLKVLREIQWPSEKLKTELLKAAAEHLSNKH